jgi:hypothetical protein
MDDVNHCWHYLGRSGEAKGPSKQGVALVWVPLMKPLPFFLLFAVFSGAKQLMRCKACEKLAEQVQKRMDETAMKGGQVTVGHRVGPKGESVHKKVIDYANSYTEDICGRITY